MLRRRGFHVSFFLMKSDKNNLMALGLDVTIAAITGERYSVLCRVLWFNL
jgi:hypothetical protein